MSNGPPPARPDGTVDNTQWLFPLEQAPPPRDEGCTQNGFGDPAPHSSNGSPPTPSPPPMIWGPSSASTALASMTEFLCSLAVTDAKYRQACAVTDAKNAQAWAAYEQRALAMHEMRTKRIADSQRFIDKVHFKIADSQRFIDEVHSKANGSSTSTPLVLPTGGRPPGGR
jgi:hypothetical protein